MSPVQPNWMADLQKSKSQRGSVDLGKGGFKEVAVGGLLRSPPPGGTSRPMSIGGFPEGFSSGLVKKAEAAKEADGGSPEPTAKTTPRNSQAVPSPRATAGSPRSSQTTPRNSHAMPSTRALPGSPEPTKTTPRNSQSVSAAASVASPEPATTPEQEISSPPASKSIAKKSPAQSSVQSPVAQSAKSPPPAANGKPKPDAPNKDLRASLRSSRPPPSNDSGSNEPEFKNVFGKLKRTETKNYKAPDVLKDNIMRGKAALNLTGGPQKTKRVDEFKESILKQKESMKAGGGTVLKKDPSTQAPPESKVPEALARRKTLGRSNSVYNVEAPKEEKAPIRKPSGPKPQMRKPSSNIDPVKVKGEATVSTAISVENQPAPEPQPTEASKESARPISLSSPAPAPENKLNKVPKQRLTERAPASSPKSVASPPPTTTSNTTSNEGKTLPFRNAAAGGKLANRLNPALAGLLSRGPPQQGEPSGSVNSSSTDLPSTLGAGKARSEEPTTTSGTLTHTTKGRARGPKRRLPKNVVSEEKPESRVEQPAAPSPVPSPAPAVQEGPEILPKTAPARLSKSMAPPKPRSPSSSVLNLALNSPKTETAAETKVEKSKPAVSAKSPELRRVSTPKIEPRPLRDSQSNKSLGSASEASSSKVQTSDKSEDKENAADRSSVKSPLKDRIAMWSQKPESIEDLPKSPFTKTSIASWKRDPSPEKSAQTTLPQRPLGLGIRSPPPTDSPKALKSPPVVAQKSDAVKKRIVSASASPSPLSNEAARNITDFFDSKPLLQQAVQVDAQMIISRPGAIANVKTLNSLIYELTGGGKRVDMPLGREHVLFEESMYICVHQIERAGGSKVVDVYLWHGDAVGEATLQDAQLFARKVAKDYSCKLDQMAQGKETAKFIQALGGIIIVRRGSSTRQGPSSASYILRGRKHLGQIAFDEVDFSLASLVSGFSCLIVGEEGKIYLWKGKGVPAEELGCARLIGMDLGGGLEIQEIDEGEESSPFLAAFPRDGASLIFSQTLSRKSQHENYRCRLFRVSTETRRPSAAGLASAIWSFRATSPKPAPEVVVEVEPFVQSDLDPKEIWVLDTFFEIVV